MPRWTIYMAASQSIQQIKFLLCIYFPVADQIYLLCRMMKASALLLLAVATAVSVRAACPFPPGSLNGVSFDNMNSVCNGKFEIWHHVG